jgi:hypothetical protein
LLRRRKKKSEKVIHPVGRQDVKRRAEANKKNPLEEY